MDRVVVPAHSAHPQAAVRGARHVPIDGRGDDARVVLRGDVVRVGHARKQQAE